MKLSVPTYRKPNLPGLTFLERTALCFGCGFGSGFIKPAPGTWGTVVGFIYFLGLLKLPVFAAIGVTLLGLILSVWSSGICERLLGKKDPGEVVIDEIASIPFALWPLVVSPHPTHWMWLAGFLAFRFFDIAKPFPIRQLQCIRGGFGILIDDLVAALLASGVVWFVGR